MMEKPHTGDSALEGSCSANAQRDSRSRVAEGLRSFVIHDRQLTLFQSLSFSFGAAVPLRPNFRAQCPRADLG